MSGTAGGSELFSAGMSGLVKKKVDCTEMLPFKSRCVMVLFSVRRSHTALAPSFPILFSDKICK